MGAQETQQQVTEKPEPDEHDKEEAAKMMVAYEDRPTLVMPGSGKTIAGTAVNDWLDDDGNSKYANDEDSPAAKAGVKGAGKDEPTDEKAVQKGEERPEEAESEGARYQSERSAAADQTAALADKSPEELEQDARERAEQNVESDKAFNEAAIEAANKKDG